MFLLLRVVHEMKSNFCCNVILVREFEYTLFFCFSHHIFQAHLVSISVILIRNEVVLLGMLVLVFLGLYSFCRPNFT